jgi:hypothetical protein
MTNNQPSKLEQIEANLDKLTNLLAQTASRTIANENNVARLTETYLSDRSIILQLENDRRIQQAAIDALIEVQRNQQETTTLILNNMAVMQSEIRGLQTENRRILDHLLGEETDENN